MLKSMMQPPQSKLSSAEICICLNGCILDRLREPGLQQEDLSKCWRGCWGPSGWKNDRRLSASSLLSPRTGAGGETDLY